MPLTSQCTNCWKNCSFSHKNARWVLQQIPAHCGIPGNESADSLAKSGSKQLHPLPIATYQEAKALLTVKDVNGEGPLETTNPLHTQPTVWKDMSRPIYSSCEQDTVAWEHTWSELASWTLHCGIAKKRNWRSATSSRTVPPVGNSDHIYGHRMSQPPTSYGERRKTCAAPPNSWQHVDWGSKHGWSTAEEEEEEEEEEEDEERTLRFFPTWYADIDH